MILEQPPILERITLDLYGYSEVYTISYCLFLKLNTKVVERTILLR